MNEFLTYCMVLTLYETNKIYRNFNLIFNLIFYTYLIKKKKPKKRNLQLKCISRSKTARRDLSVEETPTKIPTGNRRPIPSSKITR